MRKRLMVIFLAALLLCPGIALAGGGREQTPKAVTVNGFPLKPEGDWRETRGGGASSGRALVLHCGEARRDSDDSGKEDTCCE